jgi:hypothetical protein
MPAKHKPAASRSKATEPAQPRATTPTERGDTDVDGSGASYSRDNHARQPVAGQRREGTLSKKRPEPPRTRGVDDHREEIAAEDAKTIRKASARARRLGLH